MDEVCRCGHKEEEHPVLIGEDEMGEIYCKSFFLQDRSESK